MKNLLLPLVLFIILIFSLTAFGQNYVITNAFNAPDQLPYQIPMGATVQVMNDGGVYVINPQRRELYGRLNKLFQDPDFIQGISVASLRRLEEMINGQDSSFAELVSTTKAIYNLSLTSHEKERTYIDEILNNQQEQKGLLQTLAQKQADFLQNDFDQMAKKAKRNKTFRKFVGGVCLAGAGYLVLKNGVDTLPEQVAAGALGGVGLIAMLF